MGTGERIAERTEAAVKGDGSMVDRDRIVPRHSAALLVVRFGRKGPSRLQFEPTQAVVDG